MMKGFSEFFSRHRHMVFFLLVLALLPCAAVWAATGKANLSLQVSDTSLAPGEQATVTIKVNTGSLSLSEGEEVSTISAFLLFPSEKLEIVGSLNFGSSAFPTPYVGEYDNTAGTVEIVRAGDGGTLPSSATLASFTIRAKSGANGNAALSFDSSLTGVLLNDTDNTDVFGSAASSTITINGATPTPNASTTPSSTPASGKARIWLSAARTDIAPGQTTSVNIYLDTGTSNDVTSVDLQLFFPPDLLSIVENKVNITGGALSGISQNTIDSSGGSIDLVVFNNPSVTDGSAFLGSFTVNRLKTAEAAISIGNGSGVYTNDINNTNVLSKSASAGITFSQLAGPVITANISPGSISSAQSATVTFKSSETGSYAIKPDCSSPDVYANGQVNMTNQNIAVNVSGSALGIGENKKLRVCVTNGDGITGRSDELVINVTKSETVNVSVCSLQPNPVISGQASAIDFVAAESGTLTVHRDSCNGPVVPLGFSGGKFNSYTLTTPSANCAVGKNTVTIYANDVGGAGSHTLVLCLATGSGGQGTASTVLNVASSPTSGGGGGGGGRRRTIDSSNGSGSTSGAGKAQCEAPHNFNAKSLQNGKMLFTWEKVDDPKVNGFELFWGTESGEMDKSIEIPKLTRLIFPATGFIKGEKYYFILQSEGDCKAIDSREISAVKRRDGQMIPETLRDEGAYTGDRANLPPDAAAPQSNTPGGGGSAATRRSSGQSGGSKKTGRSGNYVSLPPHIASSGPIAGGLVLLSGAGAWVWRRKRS